MRQKQIQARYLEIVQELKKIINTKGADYAYSVNNLDFFGFSGIVVRISDKFARIVNFMAKQDLSVKDERIIDTLNDLANYAILARIYYESGEMGPLWAAPTSTEVRQTPKRHGLH